MDALLARLLVVCASVLLAVIAIELLARFYLWHIASEADFRQLASLTQLKDRYGDDFFTATSEERLLKMSPHHYLGYYPTPNYLNGENRHNSLGFRGDEIPIPKPEGAYRIAAIGASTTYGAVQDYRQSYPDLLEAYLHEQGYGFVEVVNAGVGAYTSHQNLMTLQFRVLPLEPDLIILYQGWNDIRERLIFPNPRYLGDGSGARKPVIRDFFMPDLAEYSTALRILGIRSGFTKTHADIEFTQFLRAESYLGGIFAYQYQTGAYPSGIFLDLSVSDILAQNPPADFERNLTNMLAAASSHRVDALLLTMTYDRDFDESAGRSRPHKFASDEYEFAMNQHNDVTRKLAASTDTPMLDLAELFPDDHSLFVDVVHMSEKGNRARAQLIGDFVIDQFADQTSLGAAAE